MRLKMERSPESSPERFGPEGMRQRSKSMRLPGSKPGATISVQIQSGLSWLTGPTRGQALIGSKCERERQRESWNYLTKSQRQRAPRGTPDGHLLANNSVEARVRRCHRPWLHTSSELAGSCDGQVWTSFRRGKHSRQFHPNSIGEREVKWSGRKDLNL